MTDRKSASEVVTNRTWRNLPKRKPVNLSQVFMDEWRLSLESMSGRMPDVFTGKEKGMAKHLTDRFTRLTPEATEDQLRNEVQTFARWVVFEWAQVQEHLMAIHQDKVPTKPTLSILLRDLQQVLDLYSSMKKRVEQIVEGWQQDSGEDLYGKATEQVEVKLTGEKVVSYEDYMEIMKGKE